MSKQLLGQFFTTSDVFSTSDAFHAWFSLTPKNQPVLEPFAGAGHLFSYVDVEWTGFDLEPKHPNVIKRDTLRDFPPGYSTCITNPPYLAKTVISRKKLPVEVQCEDLYLDCLSQCLAHCDYVAVIIPSTFWNQKLFKDRLYAWDKLDMSVFSDTDNPVGVAYFTPEKVERTRLFVNGQEFFPEVNDIPTRVNFPVKFNLSSSVDFLVNGIDTVERDNIYLTMQRGLDLSSLRDKKGNFKPTNRNSFSVECPHLREKDLEKINAFVSEWRHRTRDFYLTSFKSCQKNGDYRKRISFTEVKWILSKFYG